MSFADLLEPGTAKACKNKFINPTITYEREESMKTKFTSQRARKLTKNAILLTFFALALSASPRSRGDAAQCNQLPTAWTYSGIGSWFTSSNWCDGVPLCAFPACISNGGTAQINSTDPAAYACDISWPL
jgi:hypothetical protein